MTKKQQGNFTIFLIATLLILFVVTWFIKDEVVRIILAFLLAFGASLMHIAIYFNTKRKIKNSTYLKHIKVEQILYSFTTFMLLSISPMSKLTTYLRIENTLVDVLPFIIFVVFAVTTFIYNRKYTKNIRASISEL